MNYQEFLDRKSQQGGMGGFEPLWMPEFLYPFQRHLTEWAIRKGRGLLLEDCGLGKTPQLLVWADNVVRHTNRPVLVLTPLAVSFQTVREAEKFGIQAAISRDGRVAPNITVTNYEQLSKFNPSDFAGVVCDESGCLKNFSGQRTKQVIEFMRTVEFRLLDTATASPNDYVELGTSSEALGELGNMDMLSRFFKNNEKTLHPLAVKYGDLTRFKWKFKAHSEAAFWKWVCSWARACRKPSDLGFDDGDFILPPLIEESHIVERLTKKKGVIFDDLPAVTLEEQKEERRATIKERCEKVATLLEHDRPAIAWCHLNPEGDLLEKIIPGARQVSGSQSDEEKEEILLAFSTGQLKKLVIKPKIGAWGLNLQHCAHETLFPSHSFEQVYQCIRRCWRFGQKNPVNVDIVTTPGEAMVHANLRRKADQANRMFSELVSMMYEAERIERMQYGTTKFERPSWL